MLKVNSAMDQKDYEKLAQDAERWNALDLKDWINRDYGFEYSRILIRETVPVYELTEERGVQRWHRVGSQPRIPLYYATDWNYACFEIAGTGMCWEIVDGELLKYLGD